MATLSPSMADVFESDLGIVQKAISSGVTDAYAKKKDSHWGLWITHCASLSLDPFLCRSKDPVPYLQDLVPATATAVSHPR